jgi:hemerythrin-like domain-containing protein
MKKPWQIWQELPDEKTDFRRCSFLNIMWIKESEYRECPARTWNPLPDSSGQREENMTKATDTLRHEHEAILEMLDAAMETARNLHHKHPMPPETLSGLVEFLRTFADRCHHGKEEGHLFPLLEQKGLPRTGGPIGVMLSEHEQGRALIRQMSDAAAQYAAGQTSAGSRWADAALDYVELLRAHIMKENNILFVMAERLLTGDEQEALSEAFEKVEQEKLGPGTHERMHALMNRLRAQILSGTGSSR